MGWFVDAYGYTHLQGTLQWAGAENFIATLPSQAAPHSNVFTIVPTNNGTYADLEIDTGGNITLIDPHPPAVKDDSLVSLDGINYMAHSDGRALFGFDSVRSGGFGTADPGYVMDDSGFVHFFGSYAGGSAGGLDFPPASNVYTIAHSFAGTYTDLVIEPYLSGCDCVHPIPPRRRWSPTRRSSRSWGSRTPHRCRSSSRLPRMGPRTGRRP